MREIEKKDVDLEKGLWIIPAEKSKNGIAQTVPLSPKAHELVQQAMELNPSAPFLIPSPFQDNPLFQDSPLSEYGLAQALRRVIRDQAILKATPHDLRRTAATRISELGFNRLTVDKVLNHVDQTVGGIYDRHSYDAEKRKALEAWEKKLDEILGVPKTPDQEIEEIQSQIVEYGEAIKELKSRMKNIEKKAKEKSGGRVLTMDQARSKKVQGE